jgi:hypothetical protein
VGLYIDSNHHFHGFLYDHGQYTTLDDPLASGGVTEASGINGKGQIVGQYNDKTTIHGFLLSGGQYTTLDNPLTTHQTLASGINGHVQIVGQYEDPTGNLHGYLFHA